jgi:hypothetical protein
MVKNHAESIAPMRTTTDECAQLNELSKLNSWDVDYRQVGAGKKKWEVWSVELKDNPKGNLRSF